MTTLLNLTGISKSFGGVEALKGVSLELLSGEVHALIGENGAGKSTLIKIVTGAHGADSGRMELLGELVEDIDPLAAKSRGIAVIYQQPALFSDLTVTENIALGLERGGGLRRIDWAKRRRRAVELLTRVGSTISPDADVRELSMPEQQLVEIARAIGANARVLIMDEPTASLSEREVENLFRVIGELRAQGVGIIYVSHRLEELPQIADRVTVLRDGEWVATRSICDVDRTEMIRLMVGREVSAVYSKRDVPLGDVLIDVRNVSCQASGVRRVNLTVRSGEIVGLAGLVGAGRTELARVLFGLTPADAGDILLSGQRIQLRSPADAVRHGIAYVPEDRRRHGVILDMPVAANTSLAILKQLARNGSLDFARESQLAAQMVEQFAIKTPSIHAPVGTLSGGNQQKVALARWLAAKPRVLILDEPTQGIDVGAKAEIHRLMVDLAAKGLAIVMISSELPEILGMSDRIAVMQAGTIAGTLSRAEATQEKVLALALEHSQKQVA